MSFITVLKSGGIYTQEHVEQLFDEFCKYAPEYMDFVCLSDEPGVPGYYPLLKNYPGWWSKMEVFDQPGPWLYVDLDTVLVGPIDDVVDVAKNNWFTVLRDFNPQQRLLGTGVMGHGNREDLHLISDRFARNPEHYMRQCRSPRMWGDQGFVEDTVVNKWGMKDRLTFFQEEVPGAIVSYKKDVIRSGKIEPYNSIVCFHGKPRPWETKIRER